MKQDSRYRASMLAALLALLAFAATAQKVTLSGYVKDAATNEFLIGATLQIEGTGSGVATNAYGYYSLLVDAGKVNLLISYIGYDRQRQELDLRENTTLDFKLTSTSDVLEEVVVSANRAGESVASLEMSVEKLNAKIVKQIPAVLGEADVLKSIQLLPGVTAPTEGSGGFNVRGGAADQNLVLLDEAIVYNPSHLLGFFSVFNADAIKDVTLYKGGVPARFGGRLSSVLDIRMNEGNNKKFAVNGGIGLLSSRLTVEGPFTRVKEEGARGSFLLSGRRSYADLFLPLSSDTTINNNKLYFYDLNFRSNYRVGKNDHLFLSGYFGRDKIDVPNGFGNSWGNATATLRWNHLFGPRMFMNTSVVYSNYDYQITFYPGNSFRWESALENINAKADFTRFINNNNQLDFGFGSILYRFAPGSIRPVGNSSTVAPTDFGRSRAIENYVYVQNEQRIGSALTLGYGIRVSHFAQLGIDSVRRYANNQPVVFDTQINNYRAGTRTASDAVRNNELLNPTFGFEPRVSVNYTLNANQSLKASYNRMYQYIHLLSSTTSPTPLDIYTPSSAWIKPQVADQWALGYFRNISESRFELSLEVYYKKMQNQFDFIDGASPVLNEAPETIILNGSARAYGLEMMLRKNVGRFTGWASYTLSRSERQTPGIGSGPGINQGNFYPTNYDKPHNVALTGTYELSKRWTLSANFIFQSGRPVTYPVAKYSFAGISIPEYSQRNEYRLPAYHRLDIAATLKNKKKRHGQGQWVFGLYNVYNRQNAASITFREELTGNTETGLGTGINKAYKLTYFGLVPSVTYEFKF
jgi:hypothetical protein